MKNEYLMLMTGYLGGFNEEAQIHMKNQITMIWLDIVNEESR